MIAAQKHFRSIVADQPKEAVVVDENGQKWTKLTYPSGVVKYDFPNP